MSRKLPLRALGALWAMTTLLLATSCTGLQNNANEAPGHYDRPAIVRAPARAGSVVGGVVGVVLAVVLWPVTKGLNLVFDEPLGYSEREWTMLPISTSAAAGHYVLGAPGELLHYAFYGAWVAEPVPNGFDHVPTPESAGR